MYWTLPPVLRPVLPVHYAPYPAFRAEAADLESELLKAINGEYSAITCYEQLARLASNETDRDVILEIRKDEVRHYQMFTAAYTRLSGKQPAPKQTEACADNFIDGLQAAFKDEQETVDFYQDLAERIPDPFLKERIRRAAADEQNHAVWFLYMMFKNMR